MHRRRAFTLLELLAACTVLGVGFLALASTSVAIARLTGDAQRAGIAAERGQARVESMRAAGCSASSGAGVGNGVSEWWSAAPAAPGISLTDSLQFTAGAMHALRTETLATASGCP